MKDVLLRLPQVRELTGLSRSSVYAQVREGLLPPPVKIGMRSIAWPSNEVEAVRCARIARWSDDRVRELVAEMVDARTAAVAA